ncbi:MAG: hypothetical protein M1839_005238 [Geoglossum umbratile]|nr:MAG: hypothetical protein M1839_005238 [Geoglossum umbratile]
MPRDGTKTKLATPEDYISWVEDWLTYRGRIGLGSWESRPQDIADLMVMPDLGDGELEQGYLDLNSCLGRAVRDAERDKYLQTLILKHRNLASRASEILDNRIDREISGPATIENLKGPNVKPADKIIALYESKLPPPGHTVHLLSSRPQEGKLLSDMACEVRSFQIPDNTSFEDFVAKLYSESLIFWPKGHGVNQGYNLENCAWVYCLLSADDKIVSKTRRITRKLDYSALLNYLSQDRTGEIRPSLPSEGRIEETAASPTPHTSRLRRVTIDKPKRDPREVSTKGFNTQTTPGPRASVPAKKGDLGLPDGFWDDWTSDVDEDGEPLDKYGKPFFEPYDPEGIVRAVLQDPSFP